MSRSLSKSLINHPIINSKLCSPRYIQTISSLNSASSSNDHHHLTLNYLTNSCGMSLQRATSVCKLVRIKNTEKADLVLQLLRAKGFTQSQIVTLISSRPQLILCNPDKILKPKFEYFESLGLLAPWLRSALCADGKILTYSLKNRISPNVDFLKGLLKTEENFVWASKRCFSALRYNTESMLSKICALGAFGVPVPNIRRLIVLQPRLLITRLDIYEEKIQELVQMGIEPSSKAFISAFRSISAMSNSKWESKKKFLMSFGWSERDFLVAFRSQPLFMTTSEQKMKKVMEFCLTKAGLQLSDLVRSPHLFMISLERLAIPRCSVLKVLMSKGLIKKKVNVVSALNMTKKQFEDKYFTCFKEDYHELVQAYQFKTFPGFHNQIQM
ncbi:uncharacterized protein LOC110605607 [Manihot esculenta]|uniref:Uncharacterized protein n=1 Tax=Manihot esculenta TaxID=3983 RepID=A0A2C9U7M8_MANES|nr:uncharacterized protein LOC110605607 [Manihot esculenta]OAY25569.1 hypothetical protein MANES_17G105100v8 [Manihot esculenta]